MSRSKLSFHVKIESQKLNIHDATEDSVLKLMQVLVNSYEEYKLENFERLKLSVTMSLKEHLTGTKVSFSIT
jgi:hypothetical protein